MSYSSEGALVALARARALALDLHRSLGQLAVAASTGEIDVNETLYNIPGAAQELGIAPTSIRNAILAKELTAIRLKGAGSTISWAIRASDLRRFRDGSWRGRQLAKAAP